LFLTAHIYFKVTNSLKILGSGGKLFLHDPILSPGEKKQFQENHCHDEKDKFTVLLPRKSDAKPLMESRTQAVRKLEHSLRAKGQFKEFSGVFDE
jgi:hypothetical protein